MIFPEVEARVCWTHGRVNVCRHGSADSGCVWLIDNDAIKAVQAYQAGERDDWKDTP